MRNKNHKNINKLREHIKNYNKEVINIIVSEINNRFDDDYLKRVLKFIPESRRGYGAVRPYSAYLGFIFGGGDKEDKSIVKVSAALEMMNTSITYIDDKIFDNDLNVGDRVSLHIKYGLPLSMITSSIFRSIAKEIVIEMTDQRNVLEILSEMEKISQECDYGQFLDVTYGNKFKAKIKDAEKINDLRTGQFIRRCAEIGYLFAGGEDKIERKYLHNSFKLYGRAVQDANDFDDVNFSEHSPGSHGMDIKLFKKTKPIIKAIELTDSSQRDILFKVIGDIYADDESVIKSCKIIRDCGALKWAINDIKEITNNAIKIINKSNNSRKKQIINYFNIVKFIIKERFKNG